MCIGIPMQVVSCPDDSFALCRRRPEDEPVAIDIRLLGPQPEGAWLLTFLGAARSLLTAEDAGLIGDALDALDLALHGGNVDHLFADLVDRPPELPEHLR